MGGFRETNNCYFPGRERGAWGGGGGGEYNARAPARTIKRKDKDFGRAQGVRSGEVRKSVPLGGGGGRKKKADRFSCARGLPRNSARARESLDVIVRAPVETVACYCSFTRVEIRRTCGAAQWSEKNFRFY